MVDPIYRKTEAGQDEIRSRARKLDHKLRALLLMVNGERREQALLGQVAGMGIGPEAMATLLAQGLVEAVAEPAQPPVAPQEPASPVAPPAADTNLFSVYAMRHAPPTEVAAPPHTSASAVHSPAEIQAYQRLYHFYTDVIGQHLGLRGYMLQVKVEKAADLPALMALREPLHAALLKARGDITARAIMAQLDQVRDGSAA
ncbi:conserved hypothetical protein [Cupriavidus taiwanensis]|uniref:Proline-rich protein n=1 Tax=Cupriavidus taiwanensis TaxID=164546 RepID=A0A976AUS8_9BURK|nr:hypothetical protein [Cupriavidus taiwanensis]SOZ52212.1 conserved hypothetical protein [Cupriavidus taiwanensis]SOZ53747.1 conserved hypothetical protein [Cupriavidus taiwanensis]SOZ56168.1 conserved hypothetical protein [Cupriavidus taiwanensis]SPA04565.1 conserved hypothetical protein [Cupriavidus taiwanensis]SPA15949.1 conserved hypothetical protein [Cupriavidus taiwanensis]